MKARNNLYIAAAAVVVILIAAGVLLFAGSFQQEAARKKVVDAYSALGSRLEVLSIKEENGVYKMVLKPMDSNTVQEIYVTKDGQLLLRNVVRLEDFTSRILREDNFSQCLADRRVVVFGTSSDVNTLQQLQLIGSFAGRVFFDCSTNLQTCANLNITLVPTTFYQNTLYPGVQPVSLYTQLTGCTL